MASSKKQYNSSFGVTYALSCLSSCVAESITFPLDLTKTRLQAQGDKLAQSSSSSVSKVAKDSIKGPKPAHSPTPYRGLFGTMFGIVREEGWRKLYSGHVLN